MIRIGIDVGSTTVKVVALDEAGKTIFSKYQRHNAKAFETLAPALRELSELAGDVEAELCFTGSVGMGFSERLGLPFIQEVVAASRAVQASFPQVKSMIDIGGEDAKVVFFRDGKPHDLRMNGNCAGGTGAFIDQMAVLMGCGIDELNSLALNAKQIYTIASRCGVFCKTDIQNLASRGICREDIAASIFHAVAIQTVVTLAHGFDIKSPLLFCGGPLTFIPALRKEFISYLGLSVNEADPCLSPDVVLPEDGALLPAHGAALACGPGMAPMRLGELIGRIESGAGEAVFRSGMRPIFENSYEYEEWKRRMGKKVLRRRPLTAGCHEVYLGIDSGSTTTKIVVTDMASNILFSYYHANEGNPVHAVELGLRRLKDQCERSGASLEILGSCSTGYGEDLIKTAFQLHGGMIETIAHYMAARYLDPEVSFILDIGGQDMKAIFVDNGFIDRVEINEACSSGCGSFIETFARTLGYTPSLFAEAACKGGSPSDLGTRCTVFMNSKVKQALRDGAAVGDIAAGLAYSVVRNCLYKVLKLKDISSLGKHIVVQGGTMRNDAVVRALELLSGAEVTRCDVPELMGAFGCALYAKAHPGKVGLHLGDILEKASYESSGLHCKGCHNRCTVTRYRFANGKTYYSGNKCERVFGGSGGDKKGVNAYEKKSELLFRDVPQPCRPLATVGIPRALNAYEDYPFWQTLFAECGIKTLLSDPSDMRAYEKTARLVMSDNICFPAKLVHGHIANLIEKGARRIFLPFVIYETPDGGQNSYNCPIVTGYSEVVKSVQEDGVRIDSPAISFKDEKLLLRQCSDYLKGFGVEGRTVAAALPHALEARKRFNAEMARYDEEVLEEARKEGRMTILLAGRPYHSDPLIQHDISRMISEMGADVITDDIVRLKTVGDERVDFLRQWSYPNRILKAALWCAAQGPDVQFVELTSFGCGPDAFLLDQVRDLLLRHGKSLTQLKLDDICNPGSLKLRVRSLIESMKLAGEGNLKAPEPAPDEPIPIFDERCRHKKILMPFFTPFISPLIAQGMKLFGYDVECLPESDESTGDYGLRYANNEVCYPATLVVGDIVKAFASGKYDPGECAVAISQTGGQCRASNYLGLIRKALNYAGYPQVPVVSFSMDPNLGNIQPGFNLPWKKMIPPAVRILLFSDVLNKFFHAAVVREKEKGLAKALVSKYQNLACAMIENWNTRGLYGLMSQAAEEFNSACIDRETSKVGIVGEIFLEFNPFSHRHIIGWLEDRGIEVAPPVLSDFFFQEFVNRKVNVRSHVDRGGSLSDAALHLLYILIRRQIRKVNGLCRKFRYFMPFGDVEEYAARAEKVISLNAQFGEGWLLPGEIMACAASGIDHVISMQPFGCIANHIVSKGVEKKIKKFYPDIHILSLDFDSGVSDVNLTNRLLLFIDNLKTYASREEAGMI